MLDRMKSAVIRHCEERSGAAIQGRTNRPGSPRRQKAARDDGVLTSHRQSEATPR